MSDASASEIDTTQNSYTLTEHECAALALFFGTPHKKVPSVSEFRDTLCSIQHCKEMQLQHALRYYVSYRTWWDTTLRRKA